MAENKLTIPAGVLAARTGLEFKRKLSFDEWEQLGKVLNTYHKSIMWWIGDWLNYGEKTYGETYAQVVEATNYSYQTVANAKWIAKQIEFSRRRELLDYAHHQEVAGFEVDEQSRWLDEAEKHEWTQKELRAAIKLAKRLPPLPLPEGKYRVIYADPPWSYSDQLIDGYGAATHHYTTMAVEELAALSVKDLATENAVLFIWTTSPILDDAFEIIKAWGFDYKTSFVWDKVRHNYGHYNSVRHELLLLSTRGSCLPDVKTLHDSVIVLERTNEHSRKPEYFRQLIDELYTPNGLDRVELFARGSLPEHWIGWGHEARNGRKD